MSEKIICTCCGEEYTEDMMRKHNGDWYCDDCFYDCYAICDRCGEVVDIDDIHYVECEDRHVCDKCADEYYRECYQCGTLVPRYDTRYLEGEYYCEDCFDDLAFYCDECDDYVTEENWDFTHGCCCDCAENHHGNIIGGYHSHGFYKVGNANFSKNIFHKGVELEVENRSEELYNDELAEKISELYEHIVFETDGSLDNGFEIITQPHTFEKFNKIPWDQILEVCSSNGFRSHNTSTCGLHIHYSREFFGIDVDEQDENIGKMIAFYERHIDDLLKLSRRSWGQYQRWASGYDTDGEIERCKECVKDYHNRYHYINITNRRTIEFRLARGTLRLEPFMAWNDLHDCLVKNVKNVSYEDIDNMKVWMDGIRLDTIRYMVERNAFKEVVEMYRDMEV